MTADQILLSVLLAGVLAMLLWGRFRHDLVAAAGLLCAVVLGLVPDEQAFTGFSSPAVIIVALVLIASRALERTGVLAVLAQKLTHDSRSTTAHVAVTGLLGAAFSAFVNNVAALALLMPIDVRAARRAGRPPGITLMALSFATILGGMVTLIGTPTNIVASAVRAEQLGEPYRMFDFAPVGAAVAAAGIAFVALVGWRLVPRRADETAALVQKASFRSELLVPSGSPIVGRTVADLDEEAAQADVVVDGHAPRTARGNRAARSKRVEAGDVLVVEGSTDAIAAFIQNCGLQEAPPHAEEPEADGESPEPPHVVEAVIRADSPLIGRSARSFDLRSRFGLTLLGIARSGVLSREKVRDRPVREGDVLLLTGRAATSPSTLELFGAMPVALVRVAPLQPGRVVLAAGLFAGAVAAASAGWISFTVALGIAVVVYGFLGFLPLREIYQQIDGSVVVMLACLLPLGSAFERVGCAALVAGTIVDLTAGYSPVVALVALMVVTMTLSDALNNVATMVIMGAIAVDLAQRLEVRPDTFLMGVAVAASCAFLTPIGHKNNTLIMGPGGLRFGDYWRMGLPLEIVVLIVSVPMLLWAWPL